MPRIRIFLLASVVICACASSAGAHAQASVPLFATDTPLEITLTTDFRQMRSGRGWATDQWYDGSLVLSDGASTRQLPVKLRMRSGFRTRDNNCSFPQFFIDFTSADTAGTPFAGQQILPLTTHCRSDSVYSRYLHREFIAYRLYNLLTDKSLRTRSALITYMRSDKPVKVAKRYGFFVEHFEALAARLDSRQVELEVFHPVAADAFEMGVLEVFEFMIGNTDFSAAYAHNIVLMQPQGRPIFGVPYDFDFSGLVNAKYATPAEQFRTRSVRTRIYRGWCRDEADLQQVLAHFQDKRAQIFSLLVEFEWMPDVVVEDAGRYLQSFYDVLDSPEQLDRQIRSKCSRGVPVRGE